MIRIYNISEEDWLLAKFSIADEEANTIINYDTFRIGTSIRNFSYFDYIEGSF